MLPHRTRKLMGRDLVVSELVGRDPVVDLDRQSETQADILLEKQVIEPTIT